MNNKGFAITTILYGIMILFMLLLTSMLGLLGGMHKNMDKLINNGARDILSYTEIGYFDLNKIPSASGRMTYEIKTDSGDEVITVTAKTNDGYGYVPYYVYLEKGKNYYFRCNSNGNWGGGGDTVEAFLMLNGGHASFDTTTVHLTSGNNFKFVPPSTGTYWLRFDVNQSGKTYKFYNIKILEK